MAPTLLYTAMRDPILVDEVFLDTDGDLDMSIHGHEVPRIKILDEDHILLGDPLLDVTAATRHNRAEDQIIAAPINSFFRGSVFTTVPSKITSYSSASLFDREGEWPNSRLWRWTAEKGSNVWTFTQDWEDVFACNTVERIWKHYEHDHTQRDTRASAASQIIDDGDLDNEVDDLLMNLHHAMETTLLDDDMTDLDDTTVRSLIEADDDATFTLEPTDDDVYSAISDEEDRPCHAVIYDQRAIPVATRHTRSNSFISVSSMATLTSSCSADDSDGVKTPPPHYLADDRVEDDQSTSSLAEDMVHYLSWVYDAKVDDVPATAAAALAKCPLPSEKGPGTHHNIIPKPSKSPHSLVGFGTTDACGRKTGAVAPVVPLFVSSIWSLQPSEQGQVQW